MSFESTRQVLQTLVTYGESVAALYESRLQLGLPAEVVAALKLALAHQRRHADQTARELSALTPKVESAQFKWQDRGLLLATPAETQCRPLESVGDVIDLVSEADQSLLAYCDALSRNTNSEEVQAFLIALRDRRQQSLRDFVRQAERGLQ